MRESLLEFDEALEKAATVQSMAEHDRSEGFSSAEALNDTLLAAQVKSMALRWKGSLEKLCVRSKRVQVCLPTVSAFKTCKSNNL